MFDIRYHVKQQLMSVSGCTCVCVYSKRHAIGQWPLAHIMQPLLCGVVAYYCVIGKDLNETN